MSQRRKGVSPAGAKNDRSRAGSRGPSVPAARVEEVSPEARAKRGETFR